MTPLAALAASLRLVRWMVEEGPRGRRPKPKVLLVVTSVQASERAPETERETE